MNSRERFLAALHGQTPDRTPVAHVAALTTVELQQATGCYLPDVHSDPGKQAKLLAANHDVLGLDAVTFINVFQLRLGNPAPAQMVQSAAGAFRVMGNVNTTDLLNATPQEIERQVVENLEAGVDIVSPGCAISPNCPNANLRAMVDAVAKHAGGG